MSAFAQDNISCLIPVFINKGINFHAVDIIRCKASVIADKFIFHTGAYILKFRNVILSDNVKTFSQNALFI